MSREEKFEELRRLVDEVADLERSNHQISIELEDTRSELSMFRAKTLVAISQAKDEHGKPTYSNQKVRDAELIVRLHENENYRNLSKQVKKKTNEQTSIRIELNRLQRRKEIISLELGIPPIYP